MKPNHMNQTYSELDQLCASVRAFVIEGTFEICIKPICQAMEKYPHAPHPHNLLGIVLEKKGDHLTAMKHFRAAWALDPTYLPANHNLHIYGTFSPRGNCAFDETDVPSAVSGNAAAECDKKVTGRVVRR